MKFVCRRPFLGLDAYRIGGSSEHFSEVKCSAMPGSVWSMPGRMPAGCTCPSRRCAARRTLNRFTVSASSGTQESTPLRIQLTSWDTIGWSGLEARQKPCHACLRALQLAMRVVCTCFSMADAISICSLKP